MESVALDSFEPDLIDDDKSASLAAASSGESSRLRVEELGRIILAYSEVTEKLEQSHAQLTSTVESLRRELGEKNRLLERKNRLAALGEMATGLAHEIRNPLGGIQLYASLLAQDLKDKPDSLSLVRKIAGGVKRLDGLVSQVLQFSREIVVSPAPTDLVDVIAQAIEYAQPTMTQHDVRCTTDGPPALSCRVDPLLIGQVMLNLVLNAAQAIDKGGEIRIVFGLPKPASNAKQFVVAVSDDGPGISAEVMDRIFNPFFTTKETGTGLGLAIVHRIIEAHDGTITAGNVAGGGARFEIKI